MSASTKEIGGPIIPILRYRDAMRAIHWLSKAFAFEKKLVVPDDKGGVIHAQLTFAKGMIMLASYGREGDIEQLMTVPEMTQGRVTQSAYVVVPDTDAHHARAKAAGAKVIAPPQEWDDRGRGYSCFDLEGHIWNFGTYDPWSD
jgi:uncharacterized glyoxalase superfamily protein PhnB